MGTENESNSTVEKSKFFNKMDEAFSILCINISIEILFHVDSITTPNEERLNIYFLFGNTNELRGHQFENELTSLSPTHFDTIQDFFTKFKSMVLQLK